MINKRYYIILFLYSMIIPTDYQNTHLIKQLSTKQQQTFNDIKLIKSNKILDNVINNNIYKVGPGDEIYINIISNNLVVNNTFVISPSGDLIIPSLGMFNVNLMYISDVIEAIEKTCSKKFEKYESNITLSNLRSFKIRIQGLQQISSLVVQHVDKVSDIYNYIYNNIFNEDISSIISNRNITLKRNDKNYNVDALKINMGIESFDSYVEEGDVVVFNYKENFVDIFGAVKYSGKYEYIEGEILSDLIVLAGLLNYSDLNNIIINRGDDELIIDSKDKFEINKNDYIFIKSNNKLIKRKYAKINGSVLHPGNYIITEGMTIEDLITKAGGFQSDADLNAIKINNNSYNKIHDKEFIRITNILPQNRSTSEIAYLKSRQQAVKGTVESSNSELTNNILNFIVNNNDLVFIPFLFKNIEIIGAVKNPGMYPYNSDYNIKDYLEQSGGESNLSTKKYFIINQNGEKNKINKSFNQLKYGDIIYVEPHQDINKWNKFKEIMSVIGQIATLLAVVQSAQN